MATKDQHMHIVARVKRYTNLGWRRIEVYMLSGDCYFIEEEKYGEMFPFWDLLMKDDIIDVDSSKLPLRIRSYRRK